MNTFLSRPLTLTLATILAGALSASLAHGADNQNWPTWRGASLTGAFEGATPPTEWSEDKNIKWKSEIPGSGLATPIIWKDRIYLLTAVSKGAPAGSQPPNAGQARRPGGQGGPGGAGGGGFNREEVMREFDKDGDGQLSEEERAAMRERFGGGRRGPGARQGGAAGGGGGRNAAPQQEHDFNIVAVDRSSGEIIWSKTANTLIPHEGHHATHGFASASPVTDGTHIWASFGSRGIFCYDMEGNQVWEADIGDLRSRNGFGEAVQPAIAGDNLLLTWDNEDQSFIVALNKRTGKEVWRRDRDEPTSWTTPAIIEVDGVLQAIIPGANKSRAYNTANGDLIWEASGLTSNIIPTPVVGNGLVYLSSGYRGRAVQAIELSSKGDVSGTDNIVWSVAHSAPYVASPVLSNNRLYMNKGNDAYLTCFDALTGEVLYQDASLEGIRGIYASPIAANGHIYVVGKEGGTVVVKDSPEFEIVATNTLDDPIDASPVAVGDQLFIRGHKYLYCIESDS